MKPQNFQEYLGGRWLIAGGLLALMAFGGGPWSVDGWIDRRQAEVEAGPTQKPKVPAKPTAQA